MGGVLIPKFYLPENEYAIYKDYGSRKTSGTQELDTDEWYLRYLSYKGMNWRYDMSLSDEEIRILVEKMDKPGLETKLTETSPEELKDLSLTFYSDRKKQLLETFKDTTQEKISRLEYELVVVHEM